MRRPDRRLIFSSRRPSSPPAPSSAKFLSRDVKTLRPRLLLALALLGSAACAAEPPPLMLGAAWYPEQWPESRWNADLALMQAAGLRMVRVGEFAWSSLEPEEGRYALDWLDRAVAAAAAHHLVVVLGTPTDAPPAWLTRKYPETLRVDENGRTAEHGSRRQFSYTSPKYRELCRRIVEQLARRFGSNPDVIGWQIGNEFTEDSFDPTSLRLFQEWLQAKYQTLDALNRRWSTAYWSQTYDRWDEISLPGATGNPGLLLEYKRFVTDEWRSFQRNQIDVIRAYADRSQAITTNLGGLGWADRFNRRDLAADLDLASWDEYNAAAVGSGSATRYVGLAALDPWRSGATHDLVRGWKRRNFWVMEMQPGFVDWAPISSSLDRGATRVMAWEAVGHGADCIAFWQWRSALGGQEQYHGALVGPDGEPLPFYAEAAQIGAEFAKAGPLFRGTAPESQVAILHDYDSRWAIDFHPQTERYDQIGVLLGYYRALREQTQSVDIVDPRSDLSGYRLVMAPSLNVISPDLARHLDDYVRHGGHLVLGPRSGMKDEFNALNGERQPGPLVPALGGRVEQFYALRDDLPVSGRWGSGQATIWAELLSTRAPDTEIMLRYGPGNGWLDGQPAAITRRRGDGTISYVGAVLDPALMRAAAKALVAAAGVEARTLPVPDGVEVCRRVGEGREIFVLLNPTGTSAAIALPAAMDDVLNGGTIRQFGLPPRGVAVLSRPDEGAK
jgi:beta-galactosidase